MTRPMIRRFDLPRMDTTVHINVLDLPWESGIIIYPYSGICIEEEIIQQVGITNGTNLCD